VLERFLDRAALQKTHNFYEKHGGKTIVIARFVPVVRTFAPFVAGVSSMSHARFQFFNILGALIWVLLLVLLGYFFGNIPFIKQYLNVIVLVGIGAAVVPVAIGALWKMSRRNSKA
jgi:membrane-associated protein